MFKYILALFFGLICCTVYGADVDIQHSSRLNSNYDEVIRTCKENRVQLLESSGLKIVKQLGDNKFRCRVGNNEIVILQTITKETKKTTVVWSLVENRGRITSYHSETVFEELPNNQTSISGNVKVDLNGLGVNILNGEIRDGIARMKNTLAKLLK